MARRTVVVDPGPQGPRRPVLLREGPPQRDKKRIIDAVIGVLGAVLLVLSILLFSILPQDPPPIPQYEIAFDEAFVDDTTVQEYVFVEGESHDFTFPYEGENLYRVTVVVEWTDDVASSMADVFSMRLYDPDGNQVSDNLSFRNPEPVQDSNAIPPTYTAQTANHTITVDLAARPSTMVASAEDADETQDETEARLLPDLTRGGTGEWVLEVVMDEAGTCPDPSELDINRFNDCLLSSQDQDSGNAFQVVLTSFTRYDPVVTPLE